MKKLNKKGFTLIELIVVIAILAILAAILIPAVTGYIERANDGRDQANCRSYYSEVAMEVMLDQTTDSTAATGEVRGDYTLIYTVDDTDNQLSGFTCAGDGKTFTQATNFAIPAN